MPTVAANDIELYYEISGPDPGSQERPGKGSPLVLITGLGFGVWSWYRQLPAFSRHLTTIALDNRGVGRSSAPPGPFSIADMADDTAALIRALDDTHDFGGRAHILGLSMGGFVAQELVLRHPSLVDRLILACTNAGLGYAVPASPTTLATIMNEAEADWNDEILARGANLRFSDDFIRERHDELGELSQRRRGHRPDRELWKRQIQAVMGFSSGTRLAAVRAPTLVITGDDDPIVPPANSFILAHHLPDAHVVAIPGGRHLFFIEFAERFNREVLDFLGYGSPESPAADGARR